MFEKRCKNCRHFKDGWCEKKKKAVKPLERACSAFRLSKEYLERLDDEESEMEDLDQYD